MVIAARDPVCFRNLVGCGYRKYLAIFIKVERFDFAVLTPREQDAAFSRVPVDVGGLVQVGTELLQRAEVGPVVPDVDSSVAVASRELVFI